MSHGSRKSALYSLHSFADMPLLAVSFNPIAPTLLRRALESLVDAHFNEKLSPPRFKPATFAPPSKDLLDAIVASSNGDIRGAMMGLQFACIVDSAQGHGKKRQKTNKKDGATKIIAVTNREHSLQLFHLMGKVLFNKRPSICDWV
jgi:cell cycle checkpoint protein